MGNVRRTVTMGLGYAVGAALGWWVILPLVRSLNANATLVLGTVLLIAGSAFLARVRPRMPRVWWGAAILLLSLASLLLIVGLFLPSRG